MDDPNEIVRHLAEIEGRLDGEEGINKDWFISGGALHRNVNIGPIKQSHWSPLRQATDWGPLIEKYVYSIERPDADHDCWTFVALRNGVIARADHASLSMAVCLAVIKTARR